jgi:hypothetical protein
VPRVYDLLADLLVVCHALLVAFVVFGLIVVLLGRALGWQWVRNFYFRVIHALLICVVAAESVFGVTCPLTTWEDQLRLAAGHTVEPSSFIGRCVHQVLFYDLPEWAFTTAYCLFGAAVLATLIFVPPRRPGRRRRSVA